MCMGWSYHWCSLFRSRYFHADKIQAITGTIYCHYYIHFAKNYTFSTLRISRPWCTEKITTNICQSKEFCGMHYKKSYISWQPLFKNLPWLYNDNHFLVHICIMCPPKNMKFYANFFLCTVGNSFCHAHFSTSRNLKILATVHWQESCIWSLSLLNL